MADAQRVERLAVALRSEEARREATVGVVVATWGYFTDAEGAAQCQNRVI